MAPPKPIHVGVRAGHPKSAGSVWSVSYLAIARSEAMKFLTEDQYAHVADGFKALSREANPRCPETVSVDVVDDCFEYKDKGGPLGKINVRVYFAVIDAKRTIVALHALKKEREDQVPTHVKTLIRMRLRRLLNGDLGPLP